MARVARTMSGGQASCVSYPVQGPTQRPLQLQGACGLIESDVLRDGIHDLHLQGGGFAGECL